MAPRVVELGFKGVLAEIFEPQFDALGRGLGRELPPPLGHLALHLALVASLALGLRLFVCTYNGIYLY